LDKLQQRLLSALGFGLMLSAGALPRTPRFYPDDPLWKMPPPLPATEVRVDKVDQLYDFVINSVAPPGEHFNRPGQKPIPAQNTNTVDEVPDSEWYTNRHYRHPMSIEELRRGPDRGNQPVPPFTVVGAKTEGVSPGFQIKDAKGRRYLCKPDPLTNPEMSTAADVIGSKFFYAFGYNTPENYIVYFTRSEVSISPAARITPRGGRERRMNAGDLERVLRQAPRDSEGRYRIMASLFVPGKGVGPFEWYGTRPDDPNDIYRHEHHRELRGLYVFCAWLNHTDIKAGNTYDTLIEVDGKPVVRHYLIDFGSSLGSDSSWPKDARFGHKYMIEKDKPVLLKMFDLGIYSPDWERAKYPRIPAVGRFEAEVFDPDRWTSNYPNSAFLNRLPDDTFWAAKQVMAFKPEEIRAIVETGQYTDPKAASYITETLIKRQQKIGRTFFAKVLPLDRFTVRNGELSFEDLGVKYGFSKPREYDARWFRFNNNTGQRTPISGAGLKLPRVSPGEYVGVEISSSGDANRTVTVYLRGNSVVGVDRTW
jgi:hypothetical protein